MSAASVAGSRVSDGRGQGLEGGGGGGGGGGGRVGGGGAGGER